MSKRSFRDKYLKEDDDIELTSLVDVVFLILIFFLLTANFTKKETLVNINLPMVKNAKEQNVLSSAFEIVITEQGLYQINDQNYLVTKKTLESELKKHLNGRKFAVIRSDKGADFEYYIYLDSLLTELGVDKKSILINGAKK